MLEYQVRQTATGAASEMNTAALTRELGDGLVALGIHSPDVRVSVVDALPRPDNAGKLRTFVPLTSRTAP